MNQKRIDISIVIPVYNSSESLSELFQRIQNEMSRLQLEFEIIFVDDASKDNSWEIIQKLKTENAGTITGVRMARNTGQHLALMCGFNFAKGNLLVTMDDDLQQSPEDIEKLIRKQSETSADLVYGVYPKRSSTMMRKTGSYFIRKASKYTAQTIGEGSSFRLFSRDLVDKIRDHFHSFVFIDELVYWHTTEIETVEVSHSPRKSGKSGYSIFSLTKMFSDIVINYTAIPLRIMTWGGVTLSIISFLMGIWFILKKIFLKTTVPGFTATIVVVLFSTSILLICMGIIGQYLYKIFNHQMGKPPYTIRKVI